ncbi:MAG: peptidylprolyl isomerase, partial [Ruthenibacterium sp.]
KHTLKLTSAVLMLALCAGLFAACDGGSDALMGGASSGSAASGSTSAPAEPAHEPGLFVDDTKLEADPMMTVDGQDVSFDMYRYYYLSGKARFDGGDETLWTSEDGDKATQSLLDYTQQGILSSFAVEALAKEKKLSLTEDELKAVDDEIAALKKQFGSDETFQQALAAQYYTEEVYRALYTSSKLMDKVLAGVYGDDIRKDIKDNYVHAQHILVKYTDAEAESHPDEMKKAEEILAKVKKGDNFDALMEEYNEDTGEPAEGYYFTAGDMVQDFEDAAFKLKEGETSEIVPTSYGYHILLRLPMDEAYIDENLTGMLSQTMVAKITGDFDTKAKAFKVEYNDNYKKVAPNTMF